MNPFKLLCLSLSVAAPACEINFAYSSEESAPFQVGSGAVVPDRPGATVEMVREITEQIGCKAVFTRLPNIRVIAETQSGERDAAFTFSYKPERAEGGLVYPLHEGKPDHDRRIITTAYYLYRLKGSTVDWDGKQIINLRGVVGANTGWSIASDLRARGVPVEEANSARQNFDKLHAGHIAAYAAMEGAAAAAMVAGQDDDIEHVAIALKQEEGYVAFGQRFYAAHSDLAERFWRQLATLRDTEMSRLLAKYRAN